MKLPWIRLPTSPGLGTETPMPKPSMISPRRSSARHRSRSRSRRRSGCRRRSPGLALLPSLAATVLGIDVIEVGSPRALPPW